MADSEHFITYNKKLKGPDYKLSIFTTPIYTDATKIAMRNLRFLKKKDLQTDDILIAFNSKFHHFLLLLSRTQSIRSTILAGLHTSTLGLGGSGVCTSRIARVGKIGKLKISFTDGVVRQQECHRRFLAMQTAQVAQQAAQVQQAPLQVQQAVPLLATFWKEVSKIIYSISFFFL